MLDDEGEQGEEEENEDGEGDGERDMKVLAVGLAPGETVSLG